MDPRKDLSVREEWLASQIVDSAIHVHSALGPGLLESVYESCLEWELRSRGIGVQRQVAFPVRYGGVERTAGLRVDCVVDDLVILELKAVEAIQPLHEAQLLTYLRLSGRRLGFILNFNVPRMKDGIRRKVM